MRRTIFNLAMSVDGYIAEEDGSFAWIQGDGDSSRDTDEVFDFPTFVDSVDVIVMGSKSYEDCGVESIENYQEKKLVVATSRELEGPGNVEFIDGDICARIRGLKEENGKNIWLFGGASFADAFIKEDLIDEYIIGIIPVILGAGRPLFLGDNPTLKLHLEECTVQEGIPILRYSKR